MKALKYAPKHYAGSGIESIAAVINIGYILLSLFLTIFLIQKLIEQDFNLVIIIFISLLFSLFIRYWFLKGKLQRSVIFGVIFFNILLTGVCTIGNGINDIVIIGYPIIIGFSAIILDQKKLALASLLSIASIIWLVAGERLDFYEANIILTGDVGDFIVSSSLLLIGGFIAFSLTNNMKRSLIRSQQEILTSKKDAEKLEKETSEKLEIIEEIHRAVINSLSHIQQLIDHRQKDSDEFTPAYVSLKRKVLVIEAAHEILLLAQAPIMLDIRELTAKILSEYEKELTTPVIHIDVGNESLFVRLDLAINYGICLLELVSEADKNNTEKLIINLMIEKGTVNLKLSDFESKNNEDHGIVMDLLARQLKGVLKKHSREFTLTFTPSLNQ